MVKPCPVNLMVVLPTSGRRKTENHLWRHNNLFAWKDDTQVCDHLGLQFATCATLLPYYHYEIRGPHNVMQIE